MTAKLVLPPDVPEAEWLAARRNGVGASEVGAVAGVSRYQGPLSVWLRKVTDFEIADNAAMRWGRRFEDDILDEYIDLHPEVNVTPKPGLFADSHAPWRLVTPDWLGEDDTGPFLGETKTGMSYGDADQWGTPGTDEIPLTYLCQVTQGCDILGLSRWTLIVLLLDTRDFREYHGDLDQVLAAQLRTRVDAFWHQHVLAGVEPPADGLADTVDLLSARYSAADRDTEVDLPPDAALWVTSYRVNHEALDEYGQAKREAGNLLRQHLAAHQAAVGLINGEPVVTWRKPKTGTSSPTLRVKGVSW